ncbi:hypothetical protein [Streptomyces bobili]
MIAFMVVLSCVVVVLAAVLVGVGAGYLARREGASYPAAVLRAGAAFGTTLITVATVTGALAAVAALLR